MYAQISEPTTPKNSYDNKFSIPITFSERNFYFYETIAFEIEAVFQSLYLLRIDSKILFNL